MNTIYVAWQQPNSKEWIPVARLDRENEKYRFVYTHGATRAQDFHPFGRMDDLYAVYESTELFPLFANRLISRSRPEFKDYLRWIGLNDTSDDPMAILALTGGIRGTDSIELFQVPSPPKGKPYELNFFARSLSFFPEATIQFINELKVNASLFLMKDSQNPVDEYALALRNENPIVMVGYCPKYYAKCLGLLLDSHKKDVSVEVVKVNLDAPLNMRLLCRLKAKAPDRFSPLNEEPDFRPLAPNIE